MISYLIERRMIMFQVKTSYMLPTGDTLTNTTEFQMQQAAEEFFDRWYRAYRKCQEKGTILEYSLVMTEIRELYSILSSY